MPVPTLDVEKLPSNQGSVNAPSSGTYGEGAALERLKAALPAGSVGAPPAPGGPAASALPPFSSPEPAPAPEGAPPGPTPPAGFPGVLLHPTQQPNVPVGTPLAGGPPVGAAVTDAQRRLQVLDLLVNAPGVSDTTRDWARMVRRVILGA